MNQNPHYSHTLGVPKTWLHDRATTRTTAQLKTWKLLLNRTSDPTRPTRRAPDPNHPTTMAFLKTYNNRHSLHAWSWLRTDLHSHSYIHARLQQLGCACRVSGLFVPLHFRSQERKVHRELSLPWNIRSQGAKTPRTFAPLERSLRKQVSCPLTFAPV